MIKLFIKYHIDIFKHDENKVQKTDHWRDLFKPKDHNPAIGYGKNDIPNQYLQIICKNHNSAQKLQNKTKPKIDM